MVNWAKANSLNLFGCYNSDDHSSDGNDEVSSETRRGSPSQSRNTAVHSSQQSFSPSPRAENQGGDASTSLLTEGGATLPSSSDIQRSRTQANIARNRILSQATLPEEAQETSSRITSKKVKSATPVEESATVTPRQKVLPPATFRMTNPEHGTLTIERTKKRANKMIVGFKLKLEKPDGLTIECKHDMYVVNEDSERSGKSTFGYVNIKFPEEMKGRGVGYAYHHAAAITAKELGVGYFYIDAALSEEMLNTCKGMQMQSNYEDENYELDPESLIKNTTEKMKEKKWSLAD